MRLPATDDELLLAEALLEDATAAECDQALAEVAASLQPIQYHAHRRVKYAYADKVLDRILELIPAQR